jgi:hypothetical protein
MIEIRQAVSTDVETITQFNIALCRETEGREPTESVVLFPNPKEEGLGFSETGYVVFERLFSRMDKT